MIHLKSKKRTYRDPGGSVGLVLKCVLGTVTSPLIRSGSATCLRCPDLGASCRGGGRRISMNGVEHAGTGASHVCRIACGGSKAEESCRDPNGYSTWAVFHRHARSAVRTEDCHQQHSTVLGGGRHHRHRLGNEMKSRGKPEHLTHAARIYRILGAHPSTLLMSTS